MPNLLDKTGRSTEAIPYWDEVVKLATPQNRLYRCMRACSLATAQSTERLVSELDLLLADKDLSRGELHLLLNAAESSMKKLGGDQSQSDWGKKLNDRLRGLKDRLSSAK
ncbi:MAG: hypothetical protein QM703_03275 [Gemmatales bacterium]